MDVRTRFEQVQSRASRAASVAGRRLDTLQIADAGARVAAWSHTSACDREDLDFL